MMWSSANPRNRPDLKTRTATVERCVSSRRSSPEAEAATARPHTTMAMIGTSLGALTISPTNRSNRASRRHRLLGAKQREAFLSIGTILQSVFGRSRDFIITHHPFGSRHPRRPDYGTSFKVPIDHDVTPP